MKLYLKNYMVLALILLFGAALFGQGTSHVVYGNLETHNGSTPVPSCIYFQAFVTGGEDTLIYQPGMGSATTCTLTVDGIWMVQLSTMTYVNGDVLHVEFADICDTCESLVTDVSGAINTGMPAQDFGLVELDFCMETVVEEAVIPDETGFGVFPNPFNSAVAIRVPDGEYDIEIFDVIGNLVAHPHKGMTQGTVVWSPDASPTDVTSGVYFVRITDLNGENSSIEKVIYQK